MQIIMRRYICWVLQILLRQDECHYMSPVSSTFIRGLRFFLNAFETWINESKSHFKVSNYATTNTHDNGLFNRYLNLILKLISHLKLCLFGVYRPTGEFFTHIETSPFPVKGCKF